MRAGRSAERVWTREQARAWCDAARARGERIVLVRGSFDLLQWRIARVLAGAGARGDRVVVAVRGDRSVAAAAGPAHPVVAAFDRAALVAALRGVEGVVVDEDPSPGALERDLKPDVRLDLESLADESREAATLAARIRDLSRTRDSGGPA